MPNPKHRTSKQRRNKRRTHHKALAPTLGKCQNCGATIEFHRVCTECGYYRGKLAIEKKVATV
jgi:large subunit ribosomal protein L32